MYFCCLRSYQRKLCSSMWGWLKSFELYVSCSLLLSCRCVKKTEYLLLLWFDLFELTILGLFVHCCGLLSCLQFQNMIPSLYHQHLLHFYLLQVSIVSNILSLASCASNPALPSFSKDTVVDAIRTIVDGFLETCIIVTNTFNLC